MKKPHKKKILCGCYIRVSTDEQALVQEGSLKNQSIRLKEHIQYQNKTPNEDWVLVNEYIDDGYSAKDTNRPRFQDMIQDVEDGKINTILFCDISRLCRSVVDFLKFAERMKELNVNFTSLNNKELDTSQPYGMTILTLLATLMQFEREMTSIRTKDAYLSRSKRGLKNGGQLLGYDTYDDDDKHGRLKVNPSEAKIVRYIFNEFLKLKSAGAVADACNRMGYKAKSYTSRRGRKHEGNDFVYSTVKTVLRNKAYIGINEIHKFNKNNPDADKGQEYQAIPTDKWKPLIEKKIFNHAQELLEQNRKSRTHKAEPKSHDYLLSDLVYCHHCNHKQNDLVPMTHGSSNKNGRRYSHYMHRKKHKEHDCPLPPNVSAKLLDDAVWQRLIQESEKKMDDALLKSSLAKFESSGAMSRVEDLQIEIKDTKEAITRTQKEHDTVARLGDVSDRIKTLLAQMDDDISILKSDLKSKQAELKKLKDKTSADSRAKGILKNKKKSLNKLPQEEKIQLVRDLVSQIRLQPTSIIIDRHVGEPLVGELKVYTTKRGRKTEGSRYRRIEVEWLN